MGLKTIFGLLACCSLALISAELEGYKIYDITAYNKNDQDVLEHLAENEDYDFFSLPRALNVSSRVMIAPKDQANFESTLNKFSLIFNVVNEDVSKPVQQERYRNLKLRSLGRGISFTGFQRHNQINAYLDELAAKFPDRVTVDTIGKSYEGRVLKTITITNGDKRANKNVIWVDGGIHAREWIAPAAALYVINQLVENFAANKDLLARYDWIVLPVVNPDGYEYTHTNSRMWRKTRKPSGKCPGTDPNRNFGLHWGEVGTSRDSCSEIFQGPAAFSEPETQALRDQLLKLKTRAKFYLTIHAFGDYLLYPWGWTSALPSTVANLDEVAKAGANAIKSATGTKYTVGSSTNVMYAAAGGSDDWAFGVAGIPISITMELAAGGSTGFDPWPSQIIPFVSEAWIGIKAMAQKVMSKY